MRRFSSNFREVKYGKISGGILYRSNNPISNGHQDCNIVKQMNIAKINTVINLSDSMEILQDKVINCPYYKKIYDSNNAIALDINNRFDINDDLFCNQMQKALLFINNHNGPYLIHCEAGIDRTGFMVMLIEVLMGASFQEIVKDYMLSFVKEIDYSNKDFNKGKAIIINQLMKMKGNLLCKNDSMEKIVLNYLIAKLNLTVTDIILLRSIMCGGNKLICP